MLIVSFVQIFQLYRLLTRRLDIDLNQCLQNDLRAKEIVSILKNTKQGLKTYLFNHFKHDDIPIINTLFNYVKNIHGDVLATITSTQPIRVQNMDKTFAFRFWSTSDLVYHTFQYFDLKNLNTCSYVCSTWMYRSMSPSCMHCYCHDYKTYKNMKSMPRTSQRFSQIKYLNTHYETTWKESVEFDFVSSLKKLAILDINISSDSLSLLIKAVNTIANGIKMISVKSRGCCIMDNETATAKQLYLPQAQHVQFEYSVSKFGPFPFIISNQCQTLSLTNVIISHSWCKKVIETIHQEYLSNLNVLMMENLKIQPSTVNVAGKLFGNTNHLRFDKIRMDMLKLWRAMKNYIHDNNIQVNVIIETWQNQKNDEIISRSTLFQFINENELQCNHYFDFDIMDDRAYETYNRKNTHPIVSVDNVLKHFCQNIEFLTLFCRSKVYVGTDIFKIKFPNLKRFVFDFYDKIPIDTIAQFFKFVDQQYEYNNACFFHLDIEASICNLQSNIQEYYIKLLFTLIATWIKKHHAVIDLKLKCVAVDSTFYDVVSDERAKREFTKMYNQLFEPILKSLVNIKLDNNCPSCGTVRTYFAQPQISFDIENWQNAHDTWFQTIYELRVLTGQEQKTSDVLIFDHPHGYYKYMEKLIIK